MTGLQISLTGIVILVASMILYSSAKDAEIGHAFIRAFASIALISFLAIPVGLIIQIWS